MYKFLFSFFVLIIVLPNFLINFNLINLFTVLTGYLIVYKFLKNRELFFLVTIPLFLIGFSQTVYFFNINSKLINSDILNIIIFNIKLSHLTTYLLQNLFLTSCCILFLFFLVKSYRYYPIKISLNYLLLTLIVLFCIQFYQIKNSDSYQMKYKEKEITTSSAKWMFLRFVKNVYPLNFIRNVRTAYLKNNNIKRYHSNTKDFSFNFHKLKESNQKEIIVLVIGESARSMSFQFKDPTLRTNPLLIKRKNIFYFKNAYTPYTATTNSIPFALSGLDILKWKNNKYNEKSIISAMKELGYVTYFIDNQGDYNSLTDFFKYESDFVYATEKLMSYDGNVLPILDKVLQETSSKKKFITIHTYGSHYDYIDRYPPSFSFYKPANSSSYSKSNIKQLRNTYLNSIRYTDYLLDEIIKRIENTNSSLLYFSDHGENLYDTEEEIIFHGYYKPTKFSLNIPFLVWLSKDNLKSDYSKYEILKDNIDKNINTESVFNTLLNLTNSTDTLKYQYKKSVLNIHIKSLDSIPYFNENDNIEYFKIH